MNKYTPKDISVLNFRFFMAVAFYVLPWAVETFGWQFLEYPELEGYYLDFLNALLSAVWTVFALILLHKCWAVLPPDWARTTPGRAVGFLFIPVFNIYWMFQAQVGLATDMNRALDKTASGQNAKMSRAVAIASIVLPCLYVIVYSVLLGINHEQLDVYDYELRSGAPYLVFNTAIYIISLVFAWQMWRAAKALVLYFIEQSDSPLLSPVPAPHADDEHETP